MTDQGLFALTNFTVSVLLARWLSKSDFGAFAVAFSVLLLMGTVHSALLTDPMLVLGPSRYQERTTAYLRRLTFLHFALTSVMGVILLLVVGVLTLLEPHMTATMTLVVLSVTTPAILFLWLVRRACYFESHPRRAAVASLLYALLVPIGMLLLWQIGTLSASSALLTLALASLLAGWWVMFRVVRPTRPPETLSSAPNVIRNHWSYGRWALGIGLLSWVPTNAVLLALPLWHSLEDAGVLRVTTIIMLPVLHVYGALGPVLLPAFVRASSSGELGWTARPAMKLFIGLAIGYAPLILIFGSSLSTLLFGTQYSIDGITLWLLAAIPLVTAISTVSVAVLLALEQLDLVLWSYVAATTVTLLIGLPLVYAYDVDGALTSMLLAAATTAILATRVSRRFTARRKQPNARASSETPEKQASDKSPAWGSSAS